MRTVATQATEEGAEAATVRSTQHSDDPIFVTVLLDENERPVEIESIAESIADACADSPADARRPAAATCVNDAPPKIPLLSTA